VDATAGLFDFGAFVFGLQDFFLETFGAGSRLAAFFFPLILLFQPGGEARGFEAVAKLDPCPVAIGGLGAFALAAYFGAGGGVAEHHGGGGFVDFLAPGTGAADKSLDELLFEEAQFFEALLQRGIGFCGGHDGGSVMRFGNLGIGFRAGGGRMSHECRAS